MSSNKFFHTLETLAATPGKKDKLDIVKTFDEFERKVVKLALDPTINYFIAKLSPPTTTGTAEWDEAEFELLSNLADRTLTGNAALEQVGFSLRELSPASGELLRRVILKDLRCGVGVTLTNSAFPGLIPDFPYMRCSLPKDSNIESWDWSKGVFSQLKANGMFARIDHDDNDGSVLITSRQGNTFPPGAMSSLEKAVKRYFLRGTQSHGELTVYIDGELQTRAIGNGMLNRLQSEGETLPDNVKVRFDVWDQIPLAAAVSKGKCATPYFARYAALTPQTASGWPDIQMIPTRWCTSREEAMAHYKEIIAQGLEGTVLKHPEAIWKDGDSKDQVKFKLEVDVDLKIVGFREGTEGKRTADTFGSVICRTADDLLEVAVSGFKRDMEQYLHENRDSVMHKIMCVRGNEVSPPSESNELHSIFHPRFVELRTDKVEADTLPQVIAQFEAACT